MKKKDKKERNIWDAVVAGLSGSLAMMLPTHLMPTIVERIYLLGLVEGLLIVLFVLYAIKYFEGDEKDE